MTDQETENPKTKTVKPARSVDVIQVELDREKTALAEMRVKVEADYTAMQKKRARLERLQQKWRADHGEEEPFDPEEVGYHGSLNPTTDPALTKPYHKQHYKIAALERELEAAQKAE